MDRIQLCRDVLSMIECESGEDLCRLDESSDLRSDLNLDSLRMVGLVLRIEQRLNVEIMSSEIMKLNQASDLIDLIESKLKANVRFAA